jgi:hypothetical protein
MGNKYKTACQRIRLQQAIAILVIARSKNDNTNYLVLSVCSPQLNELNNILVSSVELLQRGH